MDKHISTQLDNFFGQYEMKVFQDGDLLIKHGENPVGVFYLTSGIVKEYQPPINKQVVVANLFTSPSFFPMSWALNQSENTHNYEAIGKVVTWVAPREQVINFVQRHPEIALDLLKRVYKGTDGLLSRLHSIAVHTNLQRVIVELIIAAKRLGADHNQGYTIPLPTHQFIELTGLPNEIAMSSLQELQKQELVKATPHSIQISNLEALQSMLDEAYL